MVNNSNNKGRIVWSCDLNKISDIDLLIDGLTLFKYI
jgi:hypothetical protein